MKLPEPVAGFRQNHGYGGMWEQVSPEYMHEADVTRMFTETQLRAETERRDAVMRLALEALGNCVGDSLLGGKQREGAIKAIQEVLG